MNIGAWFAKTVGKLDPRKLEIKKDDNSSTGSDSKDGPSVNELVIAYATAFEAGNVEEEKRIIEKLLSIVTTFEQWAKIYEASPLKKKDKSRRFYSFDDDDYFHEDIKIFESYLRVVAFVEMLKHAATFYEWWEMVIASKCRPRGASMRLERYLCFVLSNRDGELFGRIIEIIEGNFNIWILFIDWLVGQMSRAQDGEVTFEQLGQMKESLYVIEKDDHARECEPIRVLDETCKRARGLIFSKMIEKTSNVEQLIRIVADTNLRGDYDIKKPALDKAVSLAATFEEWLRIYRLTYCNEEMAEITSTAWDKIKTLAATFTDWEKVACQVSYYNDSPRYVFILQKMLDLANGLEQLAVVYRLSRNDVRNQDVKKIEEGVLAQMSKITGASTEFLAQSFVRA